MNVRTFVYLVALPALVALGHDCYLLYENLDNGFKFSSLGFIWTTYHPESYREIMHSADPRTREIIEALLTFKAFYVGLGFAFFFYILIGIANLMKIGPFSQGGKAPRRGGDMSLSRHHDRDKSKPMQYKRK